MNYLAGQINLDFRSDEPLYLQIARQVEQLVSRGTLMPGNQLPTVRELATELRINFNTVSRSYRLLDEAGLISTQRGRGTFIWEPAPMAAGQVLREQSLQDATQRYLDEAHQLGYEDREILDFIMTTLKSHDAEASWNGERNEEK